MTEKKILVAYFSASGVTKKLAERLAETIGGDLWEIVPKIPYTNADLNWQNSKSRSSVEMRDKSSRPEIVANPDAVAGYDVVFLGFPIWWYVAPTIVNTFLESCDFSGKTVVPFATSGGSGAGETDKYLRASCGADTNWRPTRVLQASSSAAHLKAWVAGLDL